ncbi:DgyrCDS8726 [Dimorphilus gyrociliatus]|uniref:DgyrCDS8726 n=1 Tax=Dimorphilus gyrociliatus TaxID=2664684 RepID=A0A7I8VUY2_9ANNE|nr:DgyrCDS8726 [Dimorphilus gyrociliatus]
MAVGGSKLLRIKLDKKVERKQIFEFMSGSEKIRDPQIEEQYSREEVDRLIELTNRLENERDFYKREYLKLAPSTETTTSPTIYHPTFGKTLIINQANTHTMRYLKMQLQSAQNDQKMPISVHI